MENFQHPINIKAGHLIMTGRKQDTLRESILKVNPFLCDQKAEIKQQVQGK